MRALLAPLSLVWARGRRRPGRWLPAVLGLAVAAAFGCGVAGEATISGDQAARAQLHAASALDRTVRLTAQGPGSEALDHQARTLLRAAGIPDPTRVVLLNPVRLSGVVVRPAAMSALSAWVGAGAARSTALGRCRTAGCPVLAVAPGALPRTLAAPGIRLPVIGRTTLGSAVPLAFAPAAGGGAPVVLSGDPGGLNALPGLSSVYRTRSWVSVLDLSGVHSWELAGETARLQRLQALLPADGSLTLSAPFDALTAARAQADRAPAGLLSAGGGALAGLAGFLILAAYALRHEREADVRRLRAAGASEALRAWFAIAEAGLLAALGLLAGAGLGVLATAMLAGAAGLPAAPVLAHSLLTSGALLGLIGGWAIATALIAAVLLLGSGRLADVLAVASVAALALTLSRGAAGGGATVLLLAPLSCLAAGVIAFRGAGAVLRGGERAARRGPATVRLALVSLARAPDAAALAIAFLTVSTGLGGFALAYRATLARGEADAAADRVPLSALVAPTAAFTTPLQVAPLARWRALAGGPVLPVRRTDATYVSGGASVTEPALGVPAAGLAAVGGWRTSDGSAPLAELARRLTPVGPVRTPGPRLTGGTLAVAARTRGGEAVVTADLRGADGSVRQLGLGTATPRGGMLRARLPAGRFELEALSLGAPTGLEVTSGHQNGESGAAATQAAALVTLGPARAGGPGSPIIPIGSWRTAGAAVAGPPGARPGTLRVRITQDGQPGLARPLQPTDLAPIPVLTDPATAAAAAGGRLALTIDGLPVSARVVGIVDRFPTLPVGAAGVVVADEATLAAALDASLPGAGRADELWIATRHPGALAAALRGPPFSGLSVTLRATVQAALRGGAAARAVMGTLLAAAIAGIVLAVLGLLVSLLGTMRDPRAERELVLIGLGPRALRRELGLRVLIPGVLGVSTGLVLAAGLTRLALAAVRATGTLSPGAPALVTVAPRGALALGALLTLALLAAAAAAGVRTAGRPR